MKIHIREANNDDNAELQTFLCDVYGFKPSTEYMNWKFVDNPAGTIIRFIAVTDENIVGQYVLWPTYLQLGKEKTLGAQSMDTFVHNKYQGLGLFINLAEECMSAAAQRGIEALYGFPNKNSYPGFIRRLNWDHVGDVPQWFRPIRLSRHGRVPKIIGPILDIGEIIIPSGRKSPADIVIKFSNSVPPEGEMKQLFQLMPNKNKCRILRSHDWLRWRYSEKSGIRYEWLSAYKNNTVIGYAVWSIEGVNYVGIISDIYAEDQLILNTIISAIVRRSKIKKCSYLTIVTNIPQVVKALKHNGFVRNNRIPLITRKMTGHTLGSNIHNFSSWEIMGGDMDTM